jgi:hypothetical protein
MRNVQRHDLPSRLLKPILAGVVALAAFLPASPHQATNPKPGPKAAAAESEALRVNNLGAAYMVNDLYRPYLNPNRSDKHYILVSRLSIVLLIAAALIYSFWVTRVKSTFFVVTAIGSGSGLVYILRWYWWRVNAWSEIAAMIAAITSAAVFRLFIYPSESSFNANGLIVLAVSTAVVTTVWIATTLLTPPSNIEQLKRFYTKVRPAGPFWSPVARALSTDSLPVDPGYSIPRSLVAWLSAIIMVYAILFGTGNLLLGHPLPGLLLLALALIAALILRVAWASRPCPQRDTGFQPVREPLEQPTTPA